MPDPIWNPDAELLAEAEAERERHRHAQPNGDGRKDWRSIELVHFSDMPPRLVGRQLVKGILEPEQVSLIAGETGTGKTFFALDRDLHIAAGKEWFGRKVSQGAVSMWPLRLGDRVAAFREHHGITENIPFAAVTSSIDLCHAGMGDLPRLIEAINDAGLGPLALVEIDTVSRVLAGGNENSSDDMGELVKSLDWLREKFRCHISAVHHLGKNAERGPRGHSLLKAAVDTVIEVSRDAGSGISTAVVVKQRDGPTEGEIVFRLHRIELGRDQDDEPVTSCVIEAVEAGDRPKRHAKLSPAQRRALQLLSKAIETGGEVPSTSNHIPPNTRCVSEDLWRDYCYQGAVSSGNQHAKQAAFKRAAQGLLAAGQVGKWGLWVWLV